jgi:hypothetical protein
MAQAIGLLVGPFEPSDFPALSKSLISVTPAKAGVQNLLNQRTIEVRSLIDNAHLCRRVQAKF